MRSGQTARSRPKVAKRKTPATERSIQQVCRINHRGESGALCQNCGLCCDGSLFSEVELADRESCGLEAMGLEIEDEDGDEPAVLVQPCGALCGTRCSIYPHRPDCCRTFECGLLRKVAAGECSIEVARRTIQGLRENIQAMRKLLREVRGDLVVSLRENYQEAVEILARRKDQSAAAQSVELQERMSAVEKAVRRHFLRD